MLKFQFCQDTVDFAGLTITSSGVVPSNKMLSAIRDFPSPKDLTGARSWFGLVNQVAWAYSTSPVMAPFRDLIKPNRKFYWDANLEKIFQDSKVAIINLVVEGVQSFDISKLIGVRMDWVTYSCRNIAKVLSILQCVARTAGNSSLLGLVLLNRLRVGIPLLKEKLLLLLWLYPIHKSLL